MEEGEIDHRIAELEQLAIENYIETYGILHLAETLPPKEKEELEMLYEMRGY
jgi:hypothetical protein